MVDTQQATPPQKAPVDGQFSALIGAGLYLVFYTAMVLFNAHPPKMPPLVWAILPPLTTVLYLLLLLYTLRFFCRLKLSVGQETLFLFATLLLFLILNPMVRDIAWQLLTGRNWQQILSQLNMNPDADPSLVGTMLQVLVPFFLILTGAFFGQFIARLIHERALLVPVAIVAGLVDFWGVYWGPVSMMSDKAPAAVSGMATAATEAVMVPKEMVLPPHLAIFGNIAPPQNIGIGDFVFLAFFLTCAYRLGFSAKRTMWGMFGGLMLSCVLIAMNGSEVFGLRISFDYLPGLVFICGGVLIANIGSWQLSRQEWLMTGLLAVFLMALIGHSVYTANQQHPKSNNDVQTFTAANGIEAFQQSRDMLVKKATSGAEIVVLDLSVLYQNEPATGLRAVAWSCIALQRSPHMTLQQARDIRMVGQMDMTKKATWIRQLQTQIPPQISQTLLTRLGLAKDTPLATLEQAKGIPENAYTLLDIKNAYSHLTALPKQFTINLTPKSGAIIENRKKVIKQLSYANLK